MTNKKAAPVQEQPSNQSPDYTAFEAIRKGLGMSGIEHDDWDFIAQRVFDSLKQAGLMKPDFESIVRGMEPDAYMIRILHVHYSWPPEEGKRIPRDLARAQEIAAAIVAEYGGSVETVRFSKLPKEGAVGVTACGTEISIYFQDEEVSQ